MITNMALLLRDVIKYRLSKDKEIHNHVVLAKKVIQMCRL